jgi:hypothetical protein
MTDVETLKNKGVNLCMLNISCGYYNPHTDNEFTVISELQNCLAFVENIIENCTDVYEHKSEYMYDDAYSYRKGSILKVGDVDWQDWASFDPYNPNDAPEYYEYLEEYDSVYDSVLSMYYDNPYITTDDVWNAYNNCFQYLTYYDIEEMLNDIKGIK